jgi:osmoprotectant transport system substrate-binding protein
VSFKDNIGPTEITYKALQNGDIDLYADYSGTLLTYLGGQPTGDRAETYTALQAKLSTTNITASQPAPAQDVNGFYVLKTTADKYKLTKVSDLTAVAPQLVFGGPPECADRPLCLGTKSQQLYNLKFKEVRKLDPGGPITNKALDDGTIDVGLLFTGSSVIKPTYVLLQDDKGLQPADNPVPVGKKATMDSAVVKILDEIDAKITPAEYNTMSLQVFNDKLDPATVATQFIKRASL